jgi:hypothetical protein
MIDVKYPDFIGATERPELDRAMERIAQAITDRRADFLFGAGMSAASDVPIGVNLATQLLGLFFPGDSVEEPRRKELAAGLPFECVVQAIEQGAGKGREDLTNYLSSILLQPKFPVSDAHRDFLSICYWGGRLMINRVFTTNFDPVLEKAFGARGVRITEINTHEIDDVIRAEKIPILYLHGTLESGNYQITETDVFDKKFKPLHQVFRSALDQADAFVFVGYSMNDPDFRSLYLDYRENMDLRKKTTKKAYVVSPAHDVNAYVLGKGIWKAREAVWLPLDAGAFFAGIKSILDRRVRREEKERIMVKYHLKDEDAFRDKVTLTSNILRVEEAEAIQFLLEARTKTGAKQ